MRGFLELDEAALAVGAISLLSAGLLASGLSAAPNVRRLPLLCRAGGVLAIVSSLPFLSAVAVLLHERLVTLTQRAWSAELFDGSLRRDARYGLVLLALGAFSAVAPAFVALLAQRRRVQALRSQEAFPLRSWALAGAVLSAAPFVLVAVALAYDSLPDVAPLVWSGHRLERWLLRDLSISAAWLAVATVAAAMPLIAARRSARRALEPTSEVLEPSRFEGCVTPPASRSTSPCAWVEQSQQLPRAVSDLEADDEPTGCEHV
jgi:hypothetical protein